MEKLKNFFKNKKITWIVVVLLVAIIAVAVICVCCLCVKDRSGSPTILNTTNSEICEEKTTMDETSDGQESTQQPSTTVESKNNGATSQDYTLRTSDGKFYEWNKSCPIELMVVNKKNPMPDGRDQDLVTWSKNLTNGGTSRINRKAKVALEKMMAAAESDGIDLWICSMHRTLETQKYLFDAELRRKGGSYEAAARETAPPGTSEHHTGLAIDFIKRGGDLDSFRFTQDCDWLMAHAAEYGFILRYAEEKMAQTDIIYEPWHFRYVGVEYAQKIKDSGLCLEEFIGNML